MFNSPHTLPSSRLPPRTPPENYEEAGRISTPYVLPDIDINSIVEKFITALQTSHSDFKQFMDSQVESVRQEMKEVRQRMDEIEKKLLETEVKLVKELGDVKSSIIKWVAGIIITAVIIQSGISFVLLRLFVK